MYRDITIQLLERLKRAPAEVLLLGFDSTLWAAELRTAGFQPLESESALPEHSVDAIVATGIEARSHSAIAVMLDRMREALRPDGLLLLIGSLAWGEHAPEGAWPASELIAGLYERGFVILERDVPGPVEDEGNVPPLHSDGPTRHEILVARREPYRVRGYGSGDEAGIQDLFRQAYPHDDRDLDHWLWKYRDNPAGGPFLSLAVDGDDRIGAHYAGYPVRFEDATREPSRSFVAFQIGDTMTAGWARGVGGRRTSLLARATRHFFHRHCAHSIAFNYGFNTGKIHRFYLRSVPGSEYLEPVPCRVLDLETASPPGPGLWDRYLGRLSVSRVTEVDAEWDAFFERVAPSYGLLARRDAGHVRWRFLDRPDRDYLLLAIRRAGRLQGWAAFRRQDEDLVWGDCLIDPRCPSGASFLLRAALEEPEGQGSRRILGWFPDRPAFWDAILRKLGFEDRRDKDDLALIYMAFEERDLASRFASHLYYTLAESDLF